MDATDFEWDAGLGVYVNKSTNVMYDGKLYFYFDKSSQKYKIFDQKQNMYLSSEEKKSRNETESKVLEEGEVDSSDEEIQEIRGEANFHGDSLRLVLWKSGDENLKPGIVFTISNDRVWKMGSGQSCDVVINEMQLEAEQISIAFNEERNGYRVSRLKGVTFFNEDELTNESASIEHLDVIRLGDTFLVCHVHFGKETCDDCEPGILIDKFLKIDERCAASGDGKRPQPRSENAVKRSLKRKYGLDLTSAEEKNPNPDNPYNDRAKLRRATEGSELPSSAIRDSESASFDTPIPETNIGRSLLMKMGWQGGGLGRDESGNSEPIAPSFRVSETAGLGFQGSSSFVSPKQKKLYKTILRYSKLT